MHRRQPLPRLWLMTDERQGSELWVALERLPRGSGVVFRHYQSEARAELFAKVRRIARRCGLLLILGGPPALAKMWGADGSHGRHRGRRDMVRTAPAHNLREIREAERAGAQLIFLSPVFETRSHAEARPLGRLKFATLARQTRLPVVALGGMNKRRALAGAYGWAGIDAWA